MVILRLGSDASRSAPVLPAVGGRRLKGSGGAGHSFEHVGVHVEVGVHRLHVVVLLE